MPSRETVRVVLAADGVAQVEMARPKVFNAFDETMISEIDSAFAELGDDPSVRIIVLSGQGKAFSAGADLQWMTRASQGSHEWNLADARRFAAMLYCIYASPKPTVARVHGVALGGGVGLACACDFTIASDDAKFAVSEARFGILPSVIGPYLTLAVGKRQAQRLALAAGRIGADEAARIGLARRVVPFDQLDASVQELVEDLLLNGPAAMSEVKTLFAQLQPGSITAAVRELTAETIARVRMSDEAREGFSAFLNKRSPKWTT